jgi:hypothetical protein
LAAHADAQGLGGRHRRQSDKSGQQQKLHVDQKAYQNALRSIPDVKKKPDPWGGMR